MDLLSELNPAQCRAVQALDGPVLILAGPGSGKTRVLTHRTAYLIRECGVDPYNVVAVTFTNKAAREMRRRLKELIGQRRLDRLTLGTFHAICARILRREARSAGIAPDFVIYDRGDQLSLIRRALRELNLDDKMYRPPAVQGAISEAKRSLLIPQEYQPRTYWHEVAGRVYGRYQELLQANHGLDFDDLLMRAVRLLREHSDILGKYQRRYVYILVDEFQDTDSAQYQLVRLLAGERKNLFVVGDEDQSIYGWRGADFRNVLRFRKDYPEAQVVLLERNYRSSQNILAAARHIISLNTSRTEKRLWTENDLGEPITVREAYDEQEEAEYVVGEIERLMAHGHSRLGDCAIMYRTNAQSRVLEDAFVRHGLPYKLVGATRFYERREIKDVMAYLRLIHNPYDDVSLRRTINVPPRGIGKRTREAFEQWAQGHSVPAYTALQLLREAKQNKIDAAEEAHRAEQGASYPAPPLDTRSSKALLSFLDLLDGLAAARQDRTVLELLDHLLEDSGYAEYVRDGTEEGEERWENIRELRTVAQDYRDLPPDTSLTTFLEDVALVSEVDNLREETDAATLLTLHMAKGLEFDNVFIVGLDEGILPHSRSMGEPDEMEEERRLCYVGMTRAKQRLYLLHTFRRTRFGSQELSEPSRFLRDIPPELVRERDISAPTRLKPTASNRKRSRPLRESTLFAPGDRVRHDQFGEGVVVSSKAHGGDEDVIVVFAGKTGIKHMVASFAKLKLVARQE
ncbi:MAG TPA: UvrD-helicase domain-containing protein [Anaerolineae bacterium]|nr:UvrD-helicase domain-containing protein [Anaerolineae bacterium]